MTDSSLPSGLRGFASELKNLLRKSRDGKHLTKAGRSKEKAFRNEEIRSAAELIDQ